MTSVDNTTNLATNLPETATQELEDSAVTDTANASAAVASPDVEASDQIESASDGLKTALQQTKDAAAKAAKGGGTGVARLVEAVVTLVSSLVSLISSLLPAKAEQAQSGSPNSSAASSGSGSTADGSGSSSSSSAAPSASSEKTPASSAAPTPSQKAGLQALTDEKGVITVRTPDGFKLKAEAREQAWQIIGPEGRATRIWGDPHVTESDGGKWDFKAQSSFVFGANKVTVETTPAKNGQTVSKRLTLYHGTERVTIGGIDTDRPFIVGLAQDGKQHDDSLSDGATYLRGMGKRGEVWATKAGGRSRVMSGS